jgi:hypothetical protein
MLMFSGLSVRPVGNQPKRKNSHNETTNNHIYVPYGYKPWLNGCFYQYLSRR